MNTKTPETDRVMKNCNGWHHVPIEKARELELERNASRADAAVMRKQFQRLIRHVETVGNSATLIESVSQSLSTNAGRELLAEVEELRCKLRALENVSVSPMEDPDLDWIDAMRADKAAAVQGLNSTLLAQLEAKSDLVKLFREEMFLKNSELQSALAEVERLREWQSAALITRWSQGGIDVSTPAKYVTVEIDAKVTTLGELTALRHKVAAAKEMAEALSQVFKSATPHPMENGAMYEAWLCSRKALTKWQEANK